MQISQVDFFCFRYQKNCNSLVNPNFIMAQFFTQKSKPFHQLLSSVYRVRRIDTI